MQIAQTDTKLSNIPAQPPISNLTHQPLIRQCLNRINPRILTDTISAGNILPQLVVQGHFQPVAHRRLCRKTPGVFLRNQ